MDQFCPNCKFYMGHEMRAVCPKCGYRISRDAVPPEKGLLKDFQDAADLRCREDDDGTLIKCPECGNRLRENKGDALQFELLGTEITVQSISSLHMNISKRAVTQIHIEFDSWSCVKGHKFYNEFRESIKQCCPVCKGPMVKFGASVLSCKKCNINLTKDSFVFIEPAELMAEEGYKHYPEPFQCETEPVQ